MLLEMKMLYLTYESKTKSVSFENFWTCLALSQTSRVLIVIYPIIYNQNGKTQHWVFGLQFTVHQFT